MIRPNVNYPLTSMMNMFCAAVPRASGRSVAGAPERHLAHTELDVVGWLVSSTFIHFYTNAFLFRVHYLIWILLSRVLLLHLYDHKIVAPKTFSGTKPIWPRWVSVLVDVSLLAQGDGGLGNDSEEYHRSCGFNCGSYKLCKLCEKSVLVDVSLLVRGDGGLGNDCTIFTLSVVVSKSCPTISMLSLT